MNAVERFSVQHYQIVALCDELKACVQGEDIHKNVDFMYEIQQNLKIMLEAHLRLEDMSLYPMLIEHEDEKIRKVALELQDEISGCAGVHENYQKEYSSIEKIRDNLSAYIKETLHFIQALLSRIQKEEAELYTLLR